MTKEQENKPSQSPGLLSVMQSVLAALFGVQSEKKREQDFTQGKASDYIVIGIIFVAIFVISMAWLVGYIIDSAQK